MFSYSVGRHHFVLWRAAYSLFVQYPEGIELAGYFALANVPLADCRCAAAVAEDHSIKLHFAVVPVALKITRFCIAEGAVVNYRLPPHLGCMHLLIQSEDGTYYLK